MKIAIYPGSFNPWHDGHTDILKKALKVFDHVVICVGVNPEKPINNKKNYLDRLELRAIETLNNDEVARIDFQCFEGLLVNYVRSNRISAVVRGLRNGQDFEFERTQQYWNEDLGISVPTAYFMCDRSLTHISSSAIRAVEVFKK